MSALNSNMPENRDTKDLECPDTTTDAVFGEITEEGPNYRSLGWFATSILMAKTMIGLGVLSIPASFEVLGLIPGIICLLTIAVITTWSMYVVGIFKLNHPEVYAIDDAGYKMFGLTGRVFLGAGFCIYWIFVAGSGMLSFSISMNAISEHGTCTAVFVAVAAIITFSFNSIRTLGRISWFALVGLFSILGAIIILTVAVGVQERPANAPQDIPWVSDYKLFKNPSFLEAASAISAMVFSYSGTSAFFAMVAEMRDPRHYPRALVLCQSTVTVTFTTIGIVVYYFCGSYTTSPALGSAGHLMKKVAYGASIPGVLVSAILVSHVTSKYIFVRLLQGSEHLTANTFRHWATWLSCTFGTTIIAYIIASAIPVFNSLVSLVGALLGTLMTFQPMACMWLYDNWRGNRRGTIGWYFMVAWCIFVILLGTFLMVSGTYGSVVEVANGYKQANGSAAWSCSDNSSS